MFEPVDIPPLRLCALAVELMDLQVNREQNILDAVTLPVNRLALKRILSAGWQSDLGGLTRQNP